MTTSQSRKINKLRHILLIFVIFSIGVNMYADYKGAEKGIKSNIFSIYLPRKLYPFVDNQSSFVLKDSNDDDLEVIGIGFRYASMAYPIRNILAYGYNKSSIIVLCDFHDGKKTLISYVDKYNSVSFKEISFENMQNDDYHWVNVRDSDYANFTKMKSWAFIFSVSFLISLAILKIKQP